MKTKSITIMPKECLKELDKTVKEFEKEMEKTAKEIRKSIYIF